MNELYNLEQVALDSYASYNFQKGWEVIPLNLEHHLMKPLVLVINSLNNFANVTISSLYFDITKDCLYADHEHSLERRTVLTVLEQVCFTNNRIP